MPEPIQRVVSKVTNRCSRGRTAALLLLLVAAGLLAGCSVRQKKEGGAEKVDINTPVGSVHVNKPDGGPAKVDIDSFFGGVHVNTQADPQDTGLLVYPGARLRPEHGNESSSANVNLSSGPFGVKVTALEYQSDDPPEKITDFYRQEMAKYGPVLQCSPGSQGSSGKRSDPDELTCDTNIHAGTLELKVGSRQRQRVVSIKPEGKGTRFALVYVQLRGKEGTL